VTIRGSDDDARLASETSQHPRIHRPHPPTGVANRDGSPLGCECAAGELDDQRVTVEAGRVGDPVGVRLEHGVEELLDQIC
jgi:hypothetical protein